jgi:hypothetical protein
MQERFLVPSNSPDRVAAFVGSALWWWWTFLAIPGAGKATLIGVHLHHTTMPKCLIAAFLTRLGVGCHREFGPLAYASDEAPARRMHVPRHEPPLSGSEQTNELPAGQRDNEQDKHVPVHSNRPTNGTWSLCTSGIATLSGSPAAVVVTCKRPPFPSK